MPLFSMVDMVSECLLNLSSATEIGAYRKNSFDIFV